MQSEKSRIRKTEIEFTITIDCEWCTVHSN